MKEKKLHPSRKTWAHYTFLSTVMLLLVGFIATSAPVHAQTPSLIPPSVTVTSPAIASPSVTVQPTLGATASEEVITSTATVGTQYPWTKQIPIKIHITPLYSGRQLEVRWQKRASLPGSPIVSSIQNPKAGKTYTFAFALTPQSTGYQRAVADIILTTDTTYYVSSKDIPLQLDANKVVQPITGSYIAYQIGMYVAMIVVFFIIIPYIIYQIYLYARKVLIPRWLESKIKIPV